MKARHWYAELYVAFAEDVTEAIAEDHIEQALLQCGDVGECEVVAIEEWVDDGEDGHLKDDDDPTIPIDDPPAVLDAMPPILRLVKPDSEAGRDIAARVKMAEERIAEKMRVPLSVLGLDDHDQADKE